MLKIVAYEFGGLSNSHYSFIRDLDLIIDSWEALKGFRQYSRCMFV